MEKRTLFNIAILIVLAFCLFQLVKLYSFVKQHEKELSQDPLMFGAKKYNLQSCTCSFVGNDNILNFNQTESKTIVANKKDLLPSIEINYSEVIK